MPARPAARSPTSYEVHAKGIGKRGQRITSNCPTHFSNSQGNLIHGFIYSTRKVDKPMYKIVGFFFDFFLTRGTVVDML